jgi:hypothetical protein
VQVVCGPDPTAVLLSASLPLVCDLNTAVLKLGRTSGRVILTVSPCVGCPLATAAAEGALPRASLSDDRGAAPALPHDNDALLRLLYNSLGFGAMIPLHLRRLSPAPPLRELRESVPFFFGFTQPIMSLAMPSRDGVHVLFIKAPTYHADTHYIVVQPVLVCVLTLAIVHTVVRGLPGMDQQRALNVSPEEMELWKTQYIPAAEALAAASQGRATVRWRGVACLGVDAWTVLGCCVSWRAGGAWV